ncbi:hypothetical protein WA026_018615 [Henosepilachna vigintioctopunctata]|uniref:Kinesin motor domain-containing protein n=1 Tax=Henosepilachna vigintioctopunctata TaxID=420089 RepID=A0AAW1U9X9_9CUCU
MTNFIEIDNGSIPVIEVENKSAVAITNVKVPESNAGDSRQRVRRFNFDCCFREDATQDDIFDCVEQVVSKAIKRRYHSCVLAYGQSSTGKTHTMMGFPHDPGLTPRLSQKIFEYLQESAIGNELDTMKTTVSYLEIYNEKVHDLLVTDNGHQTHFRTLRVREHPKKGPYVQGLTEHIVQEPQDLLKWVRLGNENRRVASTPSNPHSSRSHSVVTITCDGVRLYLVDLAGSERAGTKIHTTSRFREGANINKSLVALGNVISALAEQPSRNKTFRTRFVPYRDSVLTWLLKDTLGGNSNTVMIATISPSSGCYSETVNTLRFGQRAKLIVSCPVVNEDPKEKIIRELRSEVARLRELLKEFQGHPLGYMPEDKAPHPHETENIPIFLPCKDFDSKESSISDSPVADELIKENAKLNCEDIVAEVPEPQLQPSIHMSTEKLIPVMNVQTSISADKKQIPKFRRTASVDYTGIMDRSRTPSFGSHESLPTTKPPTSGSKLLPKPSLTPKSLTASRTLSSSNPSMRRLSVDKGSSLKDFLQKKSIPQSPKKLEKSVETESTRPAVKSKVDSHRKVVPKPRSDIVANVTRRLYLQSKNKDAGTDMEGFEEVKSEIPNELKICSNARLRLKEITQKALRAHRFKQAETQTDTVVLRVKEISTDVQDLKLHIPEVRNVDTETSPQEMVDVSVGCSLLDNSTCFEGNKFMKVSKTCAVQCSDDMLPPKENASASPAREVSPSRVSFTKYLQRSFQPIQPNIECVNPSISNPIYANSVHINVSHHYLNGKRVNSLSDDSLEEQSASNMLFPTPDLISNHNSLDPNIHATQSEQHRASRELKTQYASENTENDCQVYPQEFESEKPNEKRAEVYSIANIKERINSVRGKICTYLPERYCFEEFQMCSSMHFPSVNLKTALVIDYKDSICYDTVTIYEPTILKSCVKILPNISDDHSDFQVDEDSMNFVPNEIDFQEVPDSLEYHKVNTKKNVRFSPQKLKNGDNMMRAMSKFLEEAATLMSSITKTAKHFETSSNTPKIDDFDLQISLEDISSLEKLFRHKTERKKPKKLPSFQVQTQTDYLPCYHTSSQTLQPERVSHSTQYDEFSMPINKFDYLLEESCNKLEHTLKASHRKVSIRSCTDSEEFLSFPSLNSQNYSLCGNSELNEDLSLESNPVSYSDYGSLNRRKNFQKRQPSCSPSAFLKQLTQMRRQVMESSKENLTAENS